MLINYESGRIIFIIFIAICAVFDYKYKRLDSRIFRIMTVCEIGFYVILAVKGEYINIPSLLAGVMMGVFIYIMSGLTRGSIGTGDAWFFALSGLAVGGARNLCMFVSALLMCTVIGLGMSMKMPVRGKKLALLPIVFPFGLIIALAG